MKQDEYIKREDAARTVAGMMPSVTRSYIINAISAIPAADVVEVVRCKDCEYGAPSENGYESCFITEAIHQPNFYCALGKRKDGDAHD
jgi:hypothetical protein